MISIQAAEDVFLEKWTLTRGGVIPPHSLILQIKKQAKEENLPVSVLYRREIVPMFWRLVRSKNGITVYYVNFEEGRWNHVNLNESTNTVTHLPFEPMEPETIKDILFHYHLYVESMLVLFELERRGES